MKEKIQKKETGIVVDEGADLPQELANKYEIQVVPFKVDWGNLQNFEGNIYQKIREAEKRKIRAFIKTSQPAVGDFLLAFKEQLKKFEKLICITITSKHSGTYNSACQAKEMLEDDFYQKVEVLDSLSGSGGQALLVLKVLELIEKKLKFEEILKNLKEAVTKTKLIFMLENPERLKESGRISGVLANWLKRMQKLGIRPLLGTKKGKIVPIGIKKGVKDISSALFDEFFKKTRGQENKGKIKVVITHADNLKEALSLKEKIEKLNFVKICFINIIGQILGGLVGPGALALAWQEL